MCGRKYLINATDAEIKVYALGLGYELSDEDCSLLRENTLGFLLGDAGTETVAFAVRDYLFAYEA